MDWLDYREKLKIGFEDQEKLKFFYTKIFNILEGISHNFTGGNLQSKEYFTFCNMTGNAINHRLNGEHDGYHRYDHCIEILQAHTKSWADFIAHYIALVNSMENKRHSSWEKANFIALLKNMLTESHIPYDLLQDQDDYFIFPKGATLLDDALVSEPLAWLCAYPTTQSAFIAALKSYSNADENTASEIADKFRKTLETFFQDFFQEKKTLENCKKIYGDYLKLKGIPREISGNFETLIQAYSNFMNNYAKHRDATSDKVLEYLMYQTGNIIRLLISLK